jgi:hypothetical protein
VAEGAIGVRVIMDLCVPEGQAMRQQFSSLMNELKRDNRRVVAAMMREGMEIPDTVADLGIQYVPAQQQIDPQTGEPLMHFRGMRAMLDDGIFSCGDAAAFEAAVLEEKYRILANCLAVPQGGDDNHAVIVTAKRTIDPVANFLSGRQDPIYADLNPMPQACVIEDGRVVCFEEPACYVEPGGKWICPTVPGVTGRKETITRIFGHGTDRWAKTTTGAVVPVGPAQRRTPNPRRSR